MSGLLFFPHLHPALAGEDLPAGIHLLDPGLGPEDAASRLRPGALPLGGEELKAFLREFDRLRREVKNPKDLALLGGTAGGHFFAETSFAAREELEDALDPSRVAARRAKAAQLSLCLAYMVEESLGELAGAGELDARFRKAMAESLGLEADDDAEELTHVLDEAGALPPLSALAAEFAPSWRRTLPAFWAVAPAGAGLFVADADIADTWRDAGIAFAPASEADLAAWFPDGAPDAALETVRETGWRLLGRTRPDPEAPWLDAPRPVVVVKP